MISALRPLAWLLAVVLIALPVVAVVEGWWGAEHWPLRTLRVQGELERVDRAQLQAAVMPQARRGFFAVDLAAVQRTVDALAWVERAEVRKHWPDILEVRIVEHRPFARWGDGRLLSERGQLFPPGKHALPQNLPLLDGPEARVPEVVALYLQARTQLAAAGGVQAVLLDRRGSWSLRLGDGTAVVLGRQDPGPRLARFAALLPRLRQQNAQQQLARADLRYTNGFALTWAKATPDNPNNGSKT